MGDVASWRRAGKGDGGQGDNDEGAARVVMLVTGHEEGHGVSGKCRLTITQREARVWLRVARVGKVRGQP